MAFASLRQNGLRSALAGLGIVIGVFAVTAVVSLGEMASLGVRQGLEQLVGRSIFIFPNAAEALVSEADIQAMRRVGLRPVEGINSQASFETDLGERRFLQVNGTLGDLPALDPGVRLAFGRYFNAQEWREAQAVAVIDAFAANEIFDGSGRALGRTLSLFLNDGSRTDVRVVGVLEPTGGGGGFFGEGGTSTIYLPYTLLPDAARDGFSAVRVLLAPNDDAVALTARVQQLLDARRTPGAFRAESSLGFQRELNANIATLQTVLASIAALSLLVGGIGIMNIMLVSVTERTREIGLRKALGASAAQIRLQFSVEAIALTALGGVLGVVLSVGALYAATRLFPTFLPVFVINPTTVLLALGVSVATGLFFGIFPAVRAAQLNPIDAMRYE